MSRARCGRGGWFIGGQCSKRHGGVGLRAIRAPTLLLIGDAERLYEPQAMLKLAQRRMPGLEAVIVPGADHIAARRSLRMSMARSSDSCKREGRTRMATVDAQKIP